MVPLSASKYYHECQKFKSIIKNQIDAFEILTQVNPNLSATILIQNLQQVIKDNDLPDPVTCSDTAPDSENQLPALPHDPESTTLDPLSADSVHVDVEASETTEFEKTARLQKRRGVKVQSKKTQTKIKNKVNLNGDPTKMESIIVMNPCDNFNFKRALNVKVKLKRLKHDLINQMTLNRQLNSPNLNTTELPPSPSSPEEPIENLNEDGTTTMTVSVDGHMVKIQELTDMECEALEAAQLANDEAAENLKKNLQLVLSNSLGEAYSDLTWKVKSFHEP